MAMSDSGEQYPWDHFYNDLISDRNMDNCLYSIQIN